MTGPDGKPPKHRPVSRTLASMHSFIDFIYGVLPTHCTSIQLYHSPSRQDTAEHTATVKGLGWAPEGRRAGRGKTKAFSVSLSLSERLSLGALPSLSLHAQRCCIVSVSCVVLLYVCIGHRIWQIASGRRSCRSRDCRWMCAAGVSPSASDCRL